MKQSRKKNNKCKGFQAGVLKHHLGYTFFICYFLKFKTIIIMI